VFTDAWLDTVPAAEVTALIMVNVALAVAGCAAAVRRFIAAGPGGAIVNVSSPQAQRPVRGALPYATAKAAVEGLTRALAVDYGPRGIRVNAVALGPRCQAAVPAGDRGDDRQPARVSSGERR
jgi:NAD(P)-dependent dehydrogenase (short-subunit alcohol dehydrogenase family)